jgi:serine/threonine protein kinase
MLGESLGNYHVISKVGEGGMGVVFRARDQVLHRDVAIKVLSSRSIAEKSARDFLLHEARAASALSHPNICTICQVGEAEGQLYIVMELIEGKPLSALIPTDGLPLESVLRYGLQIASAVGHSHRRNIVHRDLKSSKVIVTPEGLVKVLDFGLARRLQKETLDQSLRTLDAQETMGGSTIQSSGGTNRYDSLHAARGTAWPGSGSPRGHLGFGRCLSAEPPLLRPVRKSCTNYRPFCLLGSPTVFGPSCNGACPRIHNSATSAPARFRPRSKRFSLLPLSWPTGMGRPRVPGHRRLFTAAFVT